MKRKKSNKFQLLISSAALLLILLVAAGVTYSWIEGGTTYSIKTEEGKDVKTGTAPVMPIANSLKINPGITQEINLNDFDKTTNNTQRLYFSEVSSSDGENFYFPIYESGEVTSYRAANTNDVGTKFINYDFKVTASKKCYLAFDETPTITATDKDGNHIDDTSAFRIMLKCGDEKHIFTTAGSELTSSAVKDINGTTENFTAEPVANYVYKTDDSAKLFQLDKDQEKVIEVSVWLDASSNKPEDLIGADVRLNMNLKAASELVKVRVYVEPRDFSDYYAYVFNEDDSVHDFGLWTGTKMTEDAETGYYYYNDGSISEDAYFIVNNNNGTQYPTGNMPKNLKIGFTDDKDSYNDEYVTYVLRNDNQWYRFDDTKITVNAQSVAFANNGETQEAAASKGTVSIDGGTGDVSASKVVYQDTVAGTDVTLTANAGNYYDFAGWYETADCSGDSLSNESSYTYNANKTDLTDKQIYAKFVEKPQYTVTFDAVTYDNSGNKLENGFTGGKIDNKTASYQVTKHRDEAVEATAAANTNYTFEGWYTDSDCTNRVETAKTLSKPVDSDINGITYYAKFVEKPKHTVTVYSKAYLSSDNITDNAGGTVTVNGGNDPVKAYEGSTVTIKAVANTEQNFRFEGWYTDSTCTTKLDGDNYSQAEKTVTVGTTDVQYYAKFVKQYTVTFNTIYGETVGNTDCGTIQIGDTSSVSSSLPLTKKVDAGTKVTLSATAKGSYELSKIYNINNISEYSTKDYEVEINGDVTYYAEFIYKKPNNTRIYFESFDFKNFKINKIYIFSTSSNNPYTDAWPGTLVSNEKYDSEYGLYYYEFETYESGQFGLVVNDGSSKQYPGNNQQFVGEIGNTYILYNKDYGFSDTNKSVTLDKFKVVNVSVTPKTYPTSFAATAGGTASASVSKGYKGKVITLTAEPNTAENFRFAGWYTNEACTDDYKVSQTENENTSLNVTLGDTDVTYFAKFVKQYTVTLKAKTNGSISGTGGSVSLDGEITDEGARTYKDIVDMKVDAGAAMTLKPATMFAQKANSGYQFENWYDSDGNMIMLPSAKQVDGDLTYYANFVTLHFVTLKVKTDGTEGGNGGKVSVDGGTNYDSTSASLGVVTGGTFTPSNVFAQLANEGYEFEGWYDSNNTKLGSLPTNPVTVSSNLTYYANFKTKASSVNCYLMGGVNVNESGDDSWDVKVNADSKIMSPGADGIYTRKVTLSKNTTYEFKVIEKDSQNNIKWYGSGSEVKSDNIYVAFASDKGNSTIKTTIAGEYIFTYNQKKHELKIKAPESTEVDLPPDDLPTTSKIAANTLIFNFGSSNPISKIWYWDDSTIGAVRDTTKYSNGTSTVSTYSFSSGVEDPKAIAFNSSLTANDGSSWPGDSYKLTGDITNADGISGPYYISDTKKTSWSSFTHLTPSLTVSQTTVNVNSSVTLSASVNGTLNSNAKYTFYVQKDGVTYRASNSKTTSNTCTWTPNVAGTYTVYVAAYDEFGIETVVSSPQTVTVN